MRCNGHDTNCNCNGKCLKMSIETLVEDFESETCVKLVCDFDRRECSDEEPVSFNPFTDNISYRTYEWEEDYAIVKGFSFEVNGAVISGKLNEEYGRVDADSGEVYEADNAALLAAIRKVCGPINYGDTALAQ